MSIDPAQYPAGQAVVQITLGQVYSEVTGMRAEMRDLTNAIKAAVDLGHDHEARIRTGEQNKADKTELGALEQRVATLERDKVDKTELKALEERATAADTALSSRTTVVERKAWIGTGIGLVAACGCSGLAVYLMTLR